LPAEFGEFSEEKGAVWDELVGALIEAAAFGEARDPCEGVGCPGESIARRFAIKFGPPAFRGNDSDFGGFHVYWSSQLKKESL